MCKLFAIAAKVLKNLNKVRTKVFFVVFNLSFLKETWGKGLNAKHAGCYAGDTLRKIHRGQRWWTLVKWSY